MKAIDLHVGDLVRMRDGARWCDPDGKPVRDVAFRVLRIQAKPGYREPWIYCEGGRAFKARDLKRAESPK